MPKKPAAKKTTTKPAVKKAVTEPITNIINISYDDVGYKAIELAKTIAGEGRPHPFIISVARNGLFLGHHILYQFKDIRADHYSIDPHIFNRKVNELTLKIETQQMQIIEYLRKAIIRRDVYIVDLIHTTGASMNIVKKLIKDMGANSITTACIYKFNDSDYKPDIIIKEMGEANKDLILRFPWEV